MPTVLETQSSDDAALSLPPPGRGERLRDAFQILSPADLAALIGVDERTLAAWRSGHRGPDFVRLGRAIFYRRADVLAWVELNVTATDRAA